MDDHDYPDQSASTRVGRYELRELLGRGGHGVVHRAFDPAIEQDVAVKILLDPDPALRARFLSEARLMRQLNDPGVVDVYDVGLHNTPDEQSRPYLVMEYCERGTLEDRLAQIGRPLTHAEGLGLIEAMTASTRSLGVPRDGHAHGIVHRDLKPSNYLIRRVAAEHPPVGDLLRADERLIVADFGIAKSVNPDATNLTMTGGTPSWSAPEQFGWHAGADGDEPYSSSAVDVTADIYAASRIVTSAISGVRPDGHGPFPQAAFAATGRLGPELRRGMSPDRDDRHASFDEWRDALVNGGTSAFGRRSLITPAVVGVLAAVVVVAAVWALAFRGADTDDATATTAPSPESNAVLGPATSDPTAGPATTDAEPAATADEPIPTFSLCPDGTHNLPGAVHQVEFTESGARLAVTNIDSMAWLVDPADGSIQQTFVGHANGVVGASFDSTGTRLATAASDDTARVWDVATGESQLLITHLDTDPAAQPFMYRTAIGPDDQLLLTTNADTTAQVWALPGGEHKLTFTEHRAGVVAGDLSADGEVAVTGDFEGVVLVWDAATGSTRLRLTEHDDAIYGAAFSHDGSLLATASADGTAIIWDAGSGEIHHVLADDQPGPTFSVAFSPDGRLLAVSGEGEVNLWDTESGDLVDQLPGYADDVHDVAFGPSGDRLATVDPDGSLALYCGG